MMLKQCFSVCVFPDFLYKKVCCGYIVLVDVIQMGTQNIYLYKIVHKKYTGCNQKITEMRDCVCGN